MSLRAGLLAALLSSGIAPLQCGQTPEAELQEDETPGDALWRLAQKFHDRHDGAAERQTLQYLVERYPASRWVAPARDELAKLGPGDPGGRETGRGPVLDARDPSAPVSRAAPSGPDAGG